MTDHRSPETAVQVLLVPSLTDTNVFLGSHCYKKIPLMSCDFASRPFQFREVILSVAVTEEVKTIARGTEQKVPPDRRSAARPLV